MQLFALSGPACVKAVHKHIDEIDPNVSMEDTVLIECQSREHGNTAVVGHPSGTLVVSQRFGNSFCIV